ncbi:PREDICTED: monoacylglycerol lipase abhd6-A-like [Branchiostoma belcheri]|uniref:acylglycerol lipase n=1 Tax=Branchiostoma belcheri TaxID=7741 RepID=A0A6P4Z1L5_BRABE|nr:PREDICTED: monoacylglycerol lipase abhd6-A-like [Branchiostoma belcheri]
MDVLPASPALILLAGGGTLVSTVAAALFVCYLRPAYILILLRWYNVWKTGFKIKFVKAAGRQVAYMERGEPRDGEPSMLFLHGFTDRKETWCEMIKYLPEHLHLIAVDLPGHGDTEIKPDDDLSFQNGLVILHQFVGAIGLDRTQFHIVGISMGGAIAGCYAASHPEQVSALTMMCPAGVRTPPLEHIGPLLIPESTTALKEMLDRVFYDWKVVEPPEMILEGVLELRKPRHDFYRKMLTESRKTPDILEKEYMDKITAPTQVIWGKHDQILPPSAAAVLEKAVPNCRVDLLDRCGHAPGNERPRKTASLLIRFRESILNNE